MSSDDTDFNPDLLEALSAKVGYNFIQIWPRTEIILIVFLIQYPSRDLSHIVLQLQEEYDSEPTTTSSEEESEDYGSGSDADRKREERRKQKEEKKAKKAEREKKSGEPKEKRTKKKKMTKLPGQPKKNQSAYFLWMNQNREQIKKDHPGLSMTEMTKKAGEIWRDLSDKTVC